jgi:peptide/nickel transport system permease protein
MKMRANTAIGGLLIGVLFATAVTAAFWTPFDPLKVNLRARLQPPSALYWLGTDEFGRDVLSRIMAGAATSVLVSVLTVTFAVAIGAVIGVITGYLRGWTDRIIMAANDALLAFPGILLALAVMIVTGANKFGIVLALGIAYVPSVVRVVRGTVLSIREREYIEASRVIGNSELYSMTWHVLPNSLAPVAVLATSMFGWVLLAESALSFLGLGVPPPAPTWGNLLAASRPYMESATWLSISPGICIALTLLGINLLGDSLRDRLDPRMVQG